ncbi:MAG: 2-oxo acid dehydrogenase subunit E2 [Planctomycetes bacterium]|nr:2-oxo acid dehydrogenase subunit E2 [Planctomycetota bacterium]
MYEFRLPDIGEGVHEGEIVKWTVEPGAALQRDQAVVEVMTDKATVELTTPVAGKLLERKAEVGQVVTVGSVLFLVDDGKGEVSTNLAGHGAAAGGHAPSKPAAPAPAAPKSAPVAAAPPPPAPAKLEVPKPAPAPAAKPAPVAAGAAAAPGTAKAAPAVNGGAELPSVAFGKVLAAPATRRMAREAGVDLNQVPGTGPHGRVTREDVERAKSGSQPPQVAPSAAPPVVVAPKFTPIAVGSTVADQRVPFRGLRRRIAEAMARSKQTAAHFTVVEDVDVTELVRVREKAKALGDAHGVKVTYMPFILKALVIALRENPWLNSSLDETTQEVVVKGALNFGIAVDTSDGLIVPVLKNAESKGILQLARDVQDLAERTRAKKVTVDDLQGSSFTITNAGNIGGVFATPVINFPEVAILGVHRIRREAGVVVRDGKEIIEPRSYMMLSCSIDHRIVDGATGARFLTRMKQLLEEPALLALA